MVSGAGPTNHNWKNAGWRVCETCGVTYHSYNKTRRFCGLKCRRFPPGWAEHLAAINLLPRKARPVKPPVVKVPKPLRIKPVKAPFVSKKLDRNCLQCGAGLICYPSNPRLYCSYQCHLDSGGAFRAGLAASKAKMKYGAKKDANHAEIFEELRKHCKALDLSDVGRGLPDGMAWIADAWHLFDVKNPKTGYGKRGLNPIQKKWIAQAEGALVYLIYTVDEAREFGRGNFAGLKSENGKQPGEANEIARPDERALPRHAGRVRGRRRV